MGWGRATFRAPWSTALSRSPSWRRSRTSPRRSGGECLWELAEELVSKRRGLSDPVAMQLGEYEGMVRRDAAADQAHVEALLRLVGRRPDADLVFADAGRRAAPPRGGGAGAEGDHTHHQHTT